MNKRRAPWGALGNFVLGEPATVGLRYAAKRLLARMTVIADQGLPVGAATLRSFRMRAISRALLQPAHRNTALALSPARSRPLWLRVRHREGRQAFCPSPLPAAIV
jgi:hypothetical protein